MRLTAKEKYSFGIGAFGKDMVYAIVATYLMMFFTDEVGISPVFVGSLFFISRFWDAINDPMMGMIVDNTKTKWGKFRPWILIGTLINAIVLVFLFLNPRQFLQGNMVYVYCSAAYILWGMTYTIMDIPYWAMIPSFSSDPHERDKMAVIPRIFATLGGSTVNTFGLMLISILGVSSKSQGYFRLGLAVSIIFVISTLITVFNVEEKNIVENKEKIKFKDVKNILLRNDQLLIIITTVIIYQMALFLFNGLLLYFFKYAILNEKLYAIFNIIALVTQLVALMMYPKIAKKISRRTIYILSCLLPVIGFLGMFVVSTAFSNITLLCIVGIIYFFGLGLSNASVTVMISNSVDYGEYKTGKRSESIIFSMQTFVVKFSTAFSGLIVGFGLDIIKYAPNATQSASTIMGMKIIMFVLPAILMLICMAIYSKFYKLNGKFYSDIIKKLELMRNKDIDLNKSDS